MVRADVAGGLVCPEEDLVARRHIDDVARMALDAVDGGMSVGDTDALLALGGELEFPHLHDAVGGIGAIGPDEADADDVAVEVGVGLHLFETSVRGIVHRWFVIKTVYQKKRVLSMFE